jgi:purine catabolism regulator
MQTAAITGLLPGEGLAVVVALRSASSRTEVAGRLSAMLRRAAASRMDGAEVVVCVGGVSRAWSQLGGELRNALEMSHAVAHAPDREWFDSTAPSLEGLLWALRDDEALREFVTRRLEPVAAHDREHRTQFMQTLRSFCDHSGRITETARELHLHRQSLYKRLQNIEELIGGDLSDPDTRLGLHFALRARRYLDALESGGETP